MEILSVGIFFILFFLITWFRFRLAIGGFIVGLPLFLAISEHIFKFKIGPVPTTLIEGVFGILLVVWLIKFAKEDMRRIVVFLKNYRTGSIFGGVFLVASAISILISGDVIPALGIWRAYFLEPAVLFIILIGRMEDKRGSSQKDGQTLSTQFLIMSLIISTISIAVYGIYQHIVGDDVFSQGLGRPMLHRVTSFFTSPNAVGLYTVPIMMLLIGTVIEKIKNEKRGWLQQLKSPLFILFLIIGVLNLVVLGLTKSDGAILAFGAGLAVTAFFLGFRKSIIVLALLGMVVGISIPRVREAVLFHDAAGRNRLALWSFSWNYVSASPYQFVFGAGLRQFNQKIQGPALNYNFTKMEKLIYPHTILFNFWTEIGLFGALSFFGLIGYMKYLGLEIWKKNQTKGAVILGMLTVIVIHGLVDVPYFKNDLAMLWWILVVVIFYTHQSWVPSSRLESFS